MTPTVGATYLVESMYPVEILQICSSLLRITGTSAGKNAYIVYRELNKIP